MGNVLSLGRVRGCVRDVRGMSGACPGCPGRVRGVYTLNTLNPQPLNLLPIALACTVEAALFLLNPKP